MNKHKIKLLVVDLQLTISTHQVLCEAKMIVCAARRSGEVLQVVDIQNNVIPNKTQSIHEISHVVYLPRTTAQLYRGVRHKTN